MTTGKHDDLTHELDGLEKAMHDADQFRTLEEQVADMKRRGIDPTKAYKDLDRKAEDEDWGDATWKENGKWEHKTPADLDDKAREEWGGDNGKPNPPPIV
ncbi:hypothetical protein AAIR29_13295 [Psychrobacter sp. FBL11]|uniref:Uncharacterized protein n=1 Tax=Psychrobacter saeujeotis TaxID=3143436 RepID=A0ABU9XB07_9GAMM|nr:hypothetical protein [uncultured Psychrobacter sp.]